MQLTRHDLQGHLFVQSYRVDAITVADRELRSSFLLSVEHLIEAWPAHAVDQLNSKTLAPLFTLNPEVVLLGTGARAVFPHQAVLAEFLTRGIGIEVMDNAAACRTFNVLANEGRKVVAAFIL